MDQVLGRDADRGREGIAVRDDPTKDRQTLCHPGERETRIVPLERHRGWSHAKLEHELLLSALDGAFQREGKRAADRRMPGHRQLFAGREDPHPDVSSPLGCEDERRFREGHFLGDALHLIGGQSLRFGEHRELVAFETVIGEHVEVEVAVHTSAG
jgi:hypothetical protein